MKVHFVACSPAVNARLVDVQFETIALMNYCPLIDNDRLKLRLRVAISTQDRVRQFGTSTENKLVRDVISVRYRLQFASTTCSGLQSKQCVICSICTVSKCEFSLVNHPHCGRPITPQIISRPVERTNENNVLMSSQAWHNYWLIWTTNSVSPLINVGGWRISGLWSWWVGL